MTSPKYKPLSFNTTVRNPERIASFLKCVEMFDGKTLTNGLIDGIIKKIINEKLYRPKSVDSNELYRTIYDSDNKFNSKQLEDIVKNAPQKHKEAGFDKGWPSRFDTMFKLAKEFGFIWYKMNDKIKISPTGRMLIQAYENGNDNAIQNIFLNAMVKYQTKNPFRQTLNDNVPLMLLLKVIKRMKDIDANSCGISRLEIAFFICWKNNNDQELFDYITSFRNEFGISHYSEDVIYNRCLEILGYGEKDKKYIKKDKIFTETTDEYIRKMKITGILSLRGCGNYLDINTFKNKKIDYILDTYDKYNLYDDEYKYYEYMCDIDNNLFDEVVEVPEDIKIKKLNELAQIYSKDEITNELKIVCSNRAESKDNLFKFIAPPTRLELLTSVALVQNFPDLVVLPNYVIDDEGIPTCHAGGGVADIVCKEKENDDFVEVSLVRDFRSQMLEMFSIQDHQIMARQNNSKTYSIFIAPIIHVRAKRCASWMKFETDSDIATIDINDFISGLKSHNKLTEFVI